MTYQELIVLALATTHLTTILSQSYITDPIRQWVLDRNGFIGYGVNCFFCTSTWVSFILGVLYLGLDIELIKEALAIATVSNGINYVYLILSKIGNNLEE